MEEKKAGEREEGRGGGGGGKGDQLLNLTESSQLHHEVECSVGIPYPSFRINARCDDLESKIAWVVGAVRYV